MLGDRSPCLPPLAVYSTEDPTMPDSAELAKAAAAVTDAAAKAVVQVSFVRENWTKLSIVVVFAFVAGFVVKALLF